MMDRWLHSAGIDPVQWRALTKAYLRIDLRRGGGPQDVDEHGRPRRRWLANNPFAPLIVASLLNSVTAALMVIALRDVFTAAFGVVTLATLNTSLVVLMDFTGFVVSANDYWVIGARPVSSRTYFAARIAAVLAYVSGGGAIMSVFPAVAFLFREQAGVPGAISAFAATTACCVAIAAAAIAVYTVTIQHVHPRRVTRAMTLVQVLSTAVSLAVFYFAIETLDRGVVRQISLADMQWIWVLPPAWFAAAVPAAAGNATTQHWIAIAAGVVFTLVALASAAGRVSLGLAERLAEAAASAEPSRRGLIERLPGFQSGEAYAVATLIRAQFRYDTRFRLTVLSMIPLTIFYLLLGLDEGALHDPFIPGERASSPIFLAITFLPMTLHSSIRYSDHWRAAWIFFAFPSDPARLAIAAKNFVAIFFLTAYVAVLAVMWSLFYERIWHAVLHAAVIGAFAHMFLQGAVFFTPTLPFAVEPRRVDQSSRVLLLIFAGSIAGGILPSVLPVLYRNALRLGALVIVLVAATAVIEIIVRRRVRNAVLQLEFS